MLPALPDLWPKGEISGLRAANGFELDLKWGDGKLQTANVKSLIGEKGVIRYRGKDILVDIKKGKSLKLGTNGFL